MSATPAGTGFAPVVGVLSPDVSSGLCVARGGSGVAVGGGATVSSVEGASVPSDSTDVVGTSVEAASEPDGSADPSGETAGDATDDGEGTAVGIARFLSDSRLLISYSAAPITTRAATSAIQVGMRFNCAFRSHGAYDADIVGAGWDGVRLSRNRAEKRQENRGPRAGDGN